MKSRIDSPLPGRLTRRIATVTTWAPDASWASRMVSFEEYLPVPTIRRDENSLPPITRFVSYIANLLRSFHRSARAPTALTSHNLRSFHRSARAPPAPTSHRL